MPPRKQPIILSSSRPLEADKETGRRPDLVRSTILTLVPSLKMAEEKKKALIVEIQQSDFSQQSTVEYFKGIVGIAAFETALKAAIDSGVLVGSLTDSLAPATDKAPKHLVAKAYCNGGDVAFFCGVDLEFETSLNHALYGHNAKRVRSSAVSVPLQPIQAAVTRRCGESIVANENYILSVQQAVGMLLHQILRKCAEEKRNTFSVQQTDANGLISVHSLIKSKKINESHILRVVTNMNQDMQLPLRFTQAWETKIIQRLVARVNSFS